MAFNRLTWIGLMVVALGWALLLSGASAIAALDVLAHAVGHPLVLSANLGLIAQATIVTGFGLAILGVLQSGFGALKHFFDAVVERSARSSPKVMAEPAKQDQRNVLERGQLKDRSYVLFRDGTIEIETLLGIRRFSSLQDAYEFIGG